MMNASECETRFLASSRIRAGSGFIFFSLFFFLPFSLHLASPTPAFFFWTHAYYPCPGLSRRILHSLALFEVQLLLMKIQCKLCN